MVPNEPRVPPQPSQIPSRSGSQTPKAATVAVPPTASRAGSRAASPTPPGLGGHSIVAKRATSPKVPKMKSNSGGHGASPLGASRATSPAASGSRAASPAIGTGSRPGTLVQGSRKRKATDDISAPSSGVSGGNSAPKLKKRKSIAGELEDKMVIEWLKSTPNAKARDCIRHFGPYLTDEGRKRKFKALVQEVAQSKGGVLVLRNAYRDRGHPAS